MLNFDLIAPMTFSFKVRLYRIQQINGLDEKSDTCVTDRYKLKCVGETSHTDDPGKYKKKSFVS